MRQAFFLIGCLCRLAYIARKHKSLSTARHVINSLYGYNAMEVQEAFTKIREQAKCSLADTEVQMVALNLLNSQNLDYFSPLHQGELFRLRAVAQQVESSPLPCSPVWDRHDKLIVESTLL